VAFSSRHVQVWR